MVNQVAETMVADKVAGVQVVLDQVARVQVVDQVAGTQVVDQVAGVQNRTEQNRTLYFDREVSVHIYKYIHIQNSYASSNRTLCIN